jgi:hypothetical protein
MLGLSRQARLADRSSNVRLQFAANSGVCSPVSGSGWRFAFGAYSTRPTVFCAEIAGQRTGWLVLHRVISILKYCARTGSLSTELLLQTFLRRHSVFFQISHRCFSIVENLLYLCLILNLSHFLQYRLPIRRSPDS